MERISIYELQNLLEDLEKKLALAAGNLADKVRFVRGFVAGSSSEFLGESKIILKEILDGISGAQLPPDSINRIKETIRKIDDEFERIE